MVPGSFPGYARLLHPAEEPSQWGGRLVRWAEVAAWSGRPLSDETQFHSIALPPDRPAGEAPWSGQGPRIGSMYLPDAEALAAILRDWTATPEQCWFCVWDGWGWESAALSTVGGVPLREPGSRAGLAGARGCGSRPVTTCSTPGRWRRSPRLRRCPATTRPRICAWPADRAWCVATEIDLAWTYVAGPAGLIDALLADSRLEALPARPDDPLTRVEDWVSGWAEQAADDLLATGEATITTCRGTVRARLTRPGQLRSGG